MDYESVTIVLPLPAKVLNPNSTVATVGGRFMKASATKKYRRLAREAAEEETIDSRPWGRVAVQSTFFHKQKRRRDEDNAKASLKAAFDGIVDSGLVKDDDAKHMTHEPLVFLIDKSHPRVELTIKRLA